MYRWLAAAVVLGCWGCAFSLDGPDPSRPRNRVPRCDSTKGLVALDGVMATAMGVAALAVVSAGSEPGLALLPLGIGALYLGGAVSGNRKANECQAALDEYTGSYGDERMALDDGEEGVDDSNGPRPRGTRPTQGQGQGPGGQQPYQGYPPYQPRPPVMPQQQATPSPVPQPPQPLQPPPQPQQPVTQQPPPQQGKPAKGPKAASPPAPDEDDWSDFWREVP